MNKIREWRFGKKEKPDVIDPAAYSRDGYLIHQGRLSGVRYGRKTSKDTGCGWIACYNFLKYMGRPMPPLKVAWDLEGLLLWGGRMGSNPFVIWWYLYRKGYHFRVAFTRRGMERLVRCAQEEQGGASWRESCRVAGVLGYMHKTGAHYTTFIDEGSYGRFLGEETPPAKLARRPARQEVPVRFLNAVYGVENHCLTVSEFFKKYVKFPMCFVIVARKE